MMVHIRCLVALLLVPLAVSTAADDLGDKAPPLKIAKWVKGQPVSLADGGEAQIRVIQFWSTRCAACRASIPLITRIQKKYADKGVVVVGVTDEQEDAERVEWFVKKMGDKMGFTVAIDDAQQTSNAYLGGYSVETVPHAFIVNAKGIVVWHGHPAFDLDEKLASVVDGTYSIETYVNAKRANELLRPYTNVIKFGGKGVRTEAMRIGNRIYEWGRSDTRLMNTLAWTILDDKQVRFRDLKLAMKAAKAAYDGCQGRDAAIVDTYARAFYENGDVRNALKYQTVAVSLVGDDPGSRRDLLRWLKKYQQEVDRD